MLAAILATIEQIPPPPPPPPPPVPPIVTAWMFDLPFTNAIDLVNNRSYPMPYRVGGASVAKFIMQFVITRWGGSTFEVEWMQSMIARQRAQTPGFAQIFDSAPIITGPDISA